MEANQSSINAPNNIQRAKTITVVLSVVGAILLVVGIELYGRVQINLLTGQTSSPYLVPGILLAVVGIGTLVSAGIYRKQQQRVALAVRAREIRAQTPSGSAESGGR